MDATWTIIIATALIGFFSTLVLKSWSWTKAKIITLEIGLARAEADIGAIKFNCIERKNHVRALSETLDKRFDRLDEHMDEGVKQFQKIEGRLSGIEALLHQQPPRVQT